VIFVTVGTSVPFDRLVSALAVVDGEELVVQSGNSTNVPAGARSVRFMPYDEVVATIHRARAVVAHAGVGTILTCLGAGKVPYVMPRLAALREAVDDHQVVFARRLAAAGLVRLVEHPDELALHLRQADVASARDARPAAALVAELRDYLGATVARNRS
jgi:UDP-N-acetylglucosamine transferase subunit ALG13